MSACAVSVCTLRRSRQGVSSSDWGFYPNRTAPTSAFRPSFVSAGADAQQQRLFSAAAASSLGLCEEEDNEDGDEEASAKGGNLSASEDGGGERRSSSSSFSLQRRRSSAGAEGAACNDDGCLQAPGQEEMKSPRARFSSFQTECSSSPEMLSPEGAATFVTPHIASQVNADRKKVDPLAERRSFLYSSSLTDPVGWFSDCAALATATVDEALATCLLFEASWNLFSDVSLVFCLLRRKDCSSSGRL